MSESIEASEIAQWHRKFAMACNNRAWELSVEIRTPARDTELLNLAHASAWHWAQVGTELNQMRAKMLLAEVHAALDFGSSALRLAQEMRDYFSKIDTPDWEIAFVHTVYAHAASAAGDSTEHRRAYVNAVAAIAAVADNEDRQVVERSFRLVPVPHDA